jgi:hypothetical protein
MVSPPKIAADIENGFMVRYPYLGLTLLTSVAIRNLSSIQFGTMVELLLLSVPSLKKSGTMLLSVQEYSLKDTEPNIHDFWLLTNWPTSSSLESWVTYFNALAETDESVIVLSLLAVNDQGKFQSKL